MRKSIFPIPTIHEDSALPGGANAVFDDLDLQVNIWPAHGRTDRYYAGKPIDLRHESRSFVPESRRDLQTQALKAFLGNSAYDIHPDRDGDMCATVSYSRESGVRVKGTRRK